ncbi:hypothetical protein ACJ41O_003401 [Fusarium nematophilum]
MASANGDPRCTICGVHIYCRIFPWDGVTGPRVWDPEIWLQNAIALQGPRQLADNDRPREILDESITRHAATGPPCHEGGCLTLLPSERNVMPQQESYLYDEDDEYGHPKGQRWYFGVHGACDDIASRLIQTSPTARVRSVRDLWITLDRRCIETAKRRSFLWGVLPWIPAKTENGTIGRSTATYYIPDYNPGGVENWWFDDPSHVPDLTTRLLSNLQHIEPATITSQAFQARFDGLPQELKDKIASILLHETMPVNCTGLMPQPCWKELVLQIPFLWDLDRDSMSDFTESTNADWDWERLYRQLMTRPTVAIFPETGGCKPWNYQDVGLSVPPGLTNRRRIWQVLEDMDPKELDAADDPDFIVYDSDLEEYIKDTAVDDGDDLGGGLDNGNFASWGDATPPVNWQDTAEW